MFPNVIKEVLQEIDFHRRDATQFRRGEEYHTLSWGAGAVSIEEAVALYGLVFVSRPDLVIELGTSTGASSLVLGAACKDIGFGKVVSIDYGGMTNTKCVNVRNRYNLPVEYIQSDSIVFLENFVPEKEKSYFVFSDTDTRIRAQEVNLVLEKFPPETLIAVHDTRDDRSDDCAFLKERVSQPIVQLPSPRGLSVLVVPETR